MWSRERRREGHGKRAGERQKHVIDTTTTDEMRGGDQRHNLLTFLLPSFSNLPSSMSNCKKDKKIHIQYMYTLYTHLYVSQPWNKSCIMIIIVLFCDVLLGCLCFPTYILSIYMHKAKTKNITLNHNKKKVSLYLATAVVRSIQQVYQVATSSKKGVIHVQ